MNPRVRYVSADFYDWTPDKTYDAVASDFFGRQQVSSSEPCSSARSIRVASCLAIVKVQVEHCATEMTLLLDLMECYREAQAYPHRSYVSPEAQEEALMNAIRDAVKQDLTRPV